MPKNQIKKAGGFTILELLIATSVFSLVLLGALAGFIRTGQLFYKGVSITQTHGDAKQVLDDVSNSINSTSASKIIPSPPGSQYSYYCVGNVRYTYNGLHTMIDLSAGQSYNPNGNYGVLRDIVSGCEAPCTAGCSQPFNNPVEMLGDHMRLSDFSITPVGSGRLYTVSITVAYGTNDVLDQTNNPPTCIGDSQDQQFCAVSTLSTSVYAEL